MERTYLDLLAQLRAAVQSDFIPWKHRKVILEHIEELERLLFAYSA